jgi:predicted flap endonuclease-1-like 5' DNA nuclease
MTKLTAIEGIAETYAGKLKIAGVPTLEALLEKGATPAGRQDLAAAADISSKLILEWINLADLFRIKGIGEEYSDLLEEAGVDTVPELAQRNAANLLAKIIQVNAEKKLVRRVPTLAQVTSWIEQAQALPRIVQY